MTDIQPTSPVKGSFAGKPVYETVNVLTPLGLRQYVQALPFLTSEESSSIDSQLEKGITLIKLPSSQTINQRAAARLGEQSTQATIKWLLSL
jgi:hypothetical protein